MLKNQLPIVCVFETDGLVAQHPGIFELLFDEALAAVQYFFDMIILRACSITKEA